MYAFCRLTDDIVDNKILSEDEKKTKLISWSNQLKLSFENKSSNNLLNRLSKVVNTFNIPQEPFFDLINGMELDLTKKRYSTFDELKEYCYKVASTVGLMTIPIFGYKNQNTVEYAKNLGIALQLTNILRDIKTDAKRDRIYLPLEDLEKFNYSEANLIDEIYNDNFVELMKYQTIRTRKFYNEANKFLSIEDKSSLFAARSMQYIYCRLLDKIIEEDYNVFSEKIKVSKLNKIVISVMVWLKYKLFY